MTFTRINDVEKRFDRIESCPSTNFENTIVEKQPAIFFFGFFNLFSFVLYFFLCNSVSSFLTLAEAEQYNLVC